MMPLNKQHDDRILEFHDFAVWYLQFMYKIQPDHYLLRSFVVRAITPEIIARGDSYKIYIGVVAAMYQDEIEWRNGIIEFIYKTRGAAKDCSYPSEG